MTNEINPIVTEARQLNKKFEEMILPYRTPLWKYCRYLTRSPWEGDDLFQDTLLKSFSTLSQLWHAVNLKSYLFRIATNIWIDHLRKNKVKMDTYEDIHGQFDYDKAEITEAMEIMLINLPPRQVAVILLMDVFDFTAKETANMIKLTEGAVYSALHRARKNLESFNMNDYVSSDTEINRTNEQERLINQLIVAINNGDTAFIVNIMSDTIHNNASPGFQEYSKDDMLHGSFGHNPGEAIASYCTLWGRQVIVVQVKNSGILELHDIREFEINNGKIVYHRGFYFCRELLIAAGQELNIPVQLKKHPGIDWT